MISAMRQSGVALILVLVVIALLAVLIIEFNYLSRVETRIVGNWENERRAYFLAKGGVNFAVYLLKMDDVGEDNLLEDWAKAIPPIPVDDGVIKLEISDEDGRINVNKLIEKDELSPELVKVTTRLFELSGIEPGLFPPLLEYSDEDSIAYEPFDTKYELTGCPGMDKLDDFLTIYSSGRININTASSSVIQSLSERIDEELAQAIIDYRSDNAFGNVAQLGGVAGITSDIVNDVNKVGTVKSSFFTVKSTAGIGDSSKTVTAVIERTKEGLDIVYWSIRD